MSKNTGLLLPTGNFSNPDRGEKIDRGAMSPIVNLMVYDALSNLENVDGALQLRQMIGRSVVLAASGRNRFARQFGSITCKPLGQNQWGPTMAAVLVIGQDMLAK